MEPVPDIIYLARRDTRMHKPRERDGGICLSRPVQQTQPDRKFRNSASLSPNNEGNRMAQSA